LNCSIFKYCHGICNEIMRSTLVGKSVDGNIPFTHALSCQSPLYCRIALGPEALSGHGSSQGPGVGRTTGSSYCMIHEKGTAEKSERFLTPTLIFREGVKGTLLRHSSTLIYSTLPNEAFKINRHNPT
jgi:hypothetical protein